jgi:hypothetical protein
MGRNKPLIRLERLGTDAAPRSEADAVILTLKSCSWASGASKSLGQRMPLVWTRCHLGGARPWFQCTGHSDGQGCGRRAAKLYLERSSAFACRCCHNLAYASQSENPRYRAISRAQKLRMRLGGSANLLERFPPKPRGMHRRTYYRLLVRAMAAQERSIALESDYLRRHYPGLLSREKVTES